MRFLVLAYGAIGKTPRSSRLTAMTPIGSASDDTGRRAATRVLGIVALALRLMGLPKLLLAVTRLHQGANDVGPTAMGVESHRVEGWPKHGRRRDGSGEICNQSYSPAMSNAHCSQGKLHSDPSEGEVNDTSQKNPTNESKPRRDTEDRERYGISDCPFERSALVHGQPSSPTSIRPLHGPKSGRGAPYRPWPLSDRRSKCLPNWIPIFASRAGNALSPFGPAPVAIRIALRRIRIEAGLWHRRRAYSADRLRAAELEHSELGRSRPALSGRIVAGRFSRSPFRPSAVRATRGWEPEANPIPLMCSQPPHSVVYSATAPDQPQSGLNGGPSRAMSYFSNSAAMTSRSGWAPREIGPNSS
jgi:hypothetical protein